MTRLMACVVALAAALWMAVLAGPSHADETGDCPIGTSAGSQSWDAETTCAEEGHAPAPTEHGNSDQTVATVHYSYTQVCQRGFGGPEADTFYGCGGPVECGEDGYMYNVFATHPDGHIESWQQCFQNIDIGPGITHEMIVNAFESVPLPESVMVVDPGRGDLLVNMAAIYSTQAEEFVKDVDLLGHTLALKITPSSYSWTPGDASKAFPSDWPGRRYDDALSPDDDPDAYVLHRYLTAGTFEISVDTTWTAQFKVDGLGDWEDVDGTVTMYGDPVELPVVEAPPVLTGS